MDPGLSRIIDVIDGMLGDYPPGMIVPTANVRGDLREIVAMLHDWAGDKLEAEKE